MTLDMSTGIFFLLLAGCFTVRAVIEGIAAYALWRGRRGGRSDRA